MGFLGFRPFLFYIFPLISYLLISSLWITALLEQRYGESRGKSKCDGKFLIFIKMKVKYYLPLTICQVIQ